MIVAGSNWTENRRKQSEPECQDDAVEQLGEDPGRDVAKVVEPRRVAKCCWHAFFTWQVATGEVESAKCRWNAFWCSPNLRVTWQAATGEVEPLGVEKDPGRDVAKVLEPRR